MIKRIFDFTIALLALTVLAPIILFTAALIAYKLGRPVIFTQIRPGENGIPFKMLKFRSMTDARDSEGNLLEDDIRLTDFGSRLRATSLDELPGLINVIKGDMSLVGPRPLLMEYLPLYNDFQKRRMEVKPGITGWAQVNGRNAISWKRKFELDVWYVENQSFWLDLKIIFLTVLKVFKRSDINAENTKTMHWFKGNEGDQQG
ncbi:Lipid carrier : UDP-N-acetylgalactosaminyltransferase [Indibacter alkaliphilus LW1]|uniref:Lipid carrier: UDP-N-acetylgalactosaminyltransferase n=1 Tax=Indibacter alkaliphilus (strain CCUG 57479 / KCTC 22604 / LW1) TaxID=1189612 RepID=S2DNU7_INDAL|nr:sugar transferase [Indibacter alkaliphilus]EOZ93616.1 Lipid carrier : UDP-N-acetylgalactosaminyltransferase [Indibacter alkaliphilus LW1]